MPTQPTRQTEANPTLPNIEASTRTMRRDLPLRTGSTTKAVVSFRSPMPMNSSPRCKPNPRERSAFGIRSQTDAIVAGYVVREFAIRNGLARRAASELAIVGAELASNIVVHGGGHGVLHMHLHRHHERRGIELRAEDEGPGFDSRAGAGVPGLGGCRGRGLGQGLNAARRFVDELEVRELEPRGLSVSAFKATPSPNPT